MSTDPTGVKSAAIPHDLEWLDAFRRMRPDEITQRDIDWAAAMIDDLVERLRATAQQEREVSPLHPDREPGDAHSAWEADHDDRP